MVNLVQLAIQIQTAQENGDLWRVGNYVILMKPLTKKLRNNGMRTGPIRPSAAADQVH